VLLKLPLEHQKSLTDFSANPKSFGRSPAS
jgi:hypothetical protein